MDFPVEQVAIADLKPHPRNYKAHPPDQLRHIAHSIKSHGFYKNVVVARDGTILAGHGVVLGAQQLGLELVPVRRLDLDPDEPRALKVLAADNEIPNLAETDDRALTEMLRALMSSEDGLLGTGFDEQQLSALAFVTRPARELTDFDAAAHWAGMPRFEVQPKMIKVIVNCGSAADCAALLGLLRVSGVSPEMGRTYSAWYPPRAREDLASVAFEEAPKDVPRG